MIEIEGELIEYKAILKKEIGIEGVYVFTNVHPGQVTDGYCFTDHDGLYTNMKADEYNIGFVRFLDGFNCVTFDEAVDDSFKNTFTEMRSIGTVTINPLLILNRSELFLSLFEDASLWSTTGKTNKIFPVCSRCFAVNDGFVATDNYHDEPRKDDICMCAYCGTGHQYNSDLTLRFCPDDELMKITSPEQYLDIMKIRRNLILDGYNMKPDMKMITTTEGTFLVLPVDENIDHCKIENKNINLYVNGNLVYQQELDIRDYAKMGLAFNVAHLVVDRHQNLAPGERADLDEPWYRNYILKDYSCQNYLSSMSSLLHHLGYDKHTLFIKQINNE